jgi:hypothetical protein
MPDLRVCFELISIQKVVSKFNESKFALNRFILLMKTDFKLFPSTALFKLLMIMLISSENRVVKGFAVMFENLMINDRSLIYSRKSNGHKIDPWGTPCFIVPNPIHSYQRVHLQCSPSDIGFGDTI